MARYPDTQIALFHATLTAMATDVVISARIEDTRPTVEQIANKAFGPNQLYIGHGDLMPDRLVQLLYPRSGSLEKTAGDPTLRDKFDQAAINFKMDLLTLEYNDLDRTSPGTRMLACGLYMIGFGFLSIPTVATFLAITRSIVFQ